jgi:hypothetical protein
VSGSEGRFRYDCSGKWFKGNVHMHTTRSDGRLTVTEAAEFYAGRGYDFICITDHRVAFVADEFDGQLPLVVLDGIELDNQRDEASLYHVVCIGDVRGITDEMAFGEALQRARSQGCLLIWAHPHWSDNTVAEGVGQRLDGVEVYNCSSHFAHGKGNGAFHWDAVLRQGHDMLGFATDDSHFIEQAPFEGGGWIVVNAPQLSREAIMASIRRGNFYSSNGPEFKSLRIEQGNRVVFQTSSIAHARLVGPREENKYKGLRGRDEMGEISFRIPDHWPSARLEIADDAGKIAWSNPLLRRESKLDAATGGGTA